jgi:hypothetical protein
LQNQNFINSSFLDVFTTAYNLQYAYSNWYDYYPTSSQYAFPIGGPNSYIKFDGTNFDEIMQIYYDNEALFIEDDGQLFAFNNSLNGYFYESPAACKQHGALVCGIVAYEIDNPI